MSLKPDEVYSILKKQIQTGGGTVDPEQIKQAVNGYLEENPVSGMTAEQEQQLEQNTENISSLSEDALFYDTDGTGINFDVEKGHAVSPTSGANLNRSDLFSTGKIYIETWAKAICIRLSEKYTALPNGGMAFYNLDEKYISGGNLYNKNVILLDIPDGATYFRTSIQSNETVINISYIRNVSDIDRLLAELFNQIAENSDSIDKINRPSTKYMLEDVDYPEKALWNNTNVSVGDTLPQDFGYPGPQPDGYFAHRAKIYTGEIISFIGTNQPANTAINKGMVITDTDFVVTKIISYTDLKNSEYIFEENGYCYLSYGVTDDELPLFKISHPIDFLKLSENVNAAINDIPERITEELAIQPINLISQEYLLNGISTAICIGDSVTEGVTTGASSIRRDLSYPARLSKMTGWTIENAGAAGLTTLQWWQNKFSSYTYSDYQIGIIELGYNSGLTDTIDTDTTGDNYEQYADTNTGAYCKIIEGMKARNSNIFIILIISPGFSTTVANVVIKIAEKYSLPYIDLRDVSYVNLQDDRYHGMHDNGNMDYTHMNAIGYLAKAEFIRSELIQIFSNHYKEINKIMLDAQ